MTARAALCRTAVAAAVTLLSACGGGWHQTRIGLVEVDGANLVVGPHCHNAARVRADESADAVVLTFEVKGQAKGDCYDVAAVVLDEELGDRAVTDSATGEPVKVGTH